MKESPFAASSAPQPDTLAQAVSALAEHPQAIERIRRSVGQAGFEVLLRQLPAHLHVMADALAGASVDHAMGTSTLVTLHAEPATVLDYADLLGPAACDALTAEGVTLSASQRGRVSEAARLLSRKILGQTHGHLLSRLNSEADALAKYLSFLSHDLRGGLNGIVLMIEVLSRELQQDARFASTVDDIDVMRRSVLDTVATMDRFLYAERFRQGTVRLRPAEFNIREPIEQASAMFRYAAADRGSTIAVDLQGEPLTVTTDRMMLLLILQCLLSNAVRFSRNALINISGATEPEGHAVTVTDHGRGIEPAFVQLLTARPTGPFTLPPKGGGMGLLLAREAARLIGGWYSVRTARDAGASVTIHLPRGAAMP